MQSVISYINSGLCHNFDLREHKFKRAHPPPGPTPGAAQAQAPPVGALPPRPGHVPLYHFQKLAPMPSRAGYPVPEYFKEFSGYNKPELSKHRKRTVQNMESSTICHHAKRKGDTWEPMKTTLTKLTTHLEG